MPWSCLESEDDDVGPHTIAAPESLQEEVVAPLRFLSDQDASDKLGHTREKHLSIQSTAVTLVEAEVAGQAGW